MKDRYTFNITSEEKNANLVFDLEDDVVWTKPLQEFVRFLSMHYGYDIGDKIEIVRRNFQGETDMTKLMEIYE